MLLHQWEPDCGKTMIHRGPLLNRSPRCPNVSGAFAGSPLSTAVAVPSAREEQRFAAGSQNNRTPDETGGSALASSRGFHKASRSFAPAGAIAPVRIPTRSGGPQPRTETQALCASRLRATRGRSVSQRHGRNLSTCGDPTSSGRANVLWHYASAKSVASHNDEAPWPAAAGSQTRWA